MSTLEDETGSVGGVSTLTRRSDHRSPMSTGTLNVSTMSMRMKSQRKRRANRQHNSNFNAGFVQVEEEVLHKSGIRGRKRYFLYCTLILLLVVALLNSLVSVWLIFILGFTHDGLTTMEFTSMGGREFLRVLADANIINMSFKDQGFLGARFEKDLLLSAQDSSTNSLNVEGGNSKMSLSGGNMTLVTDSFVVRDTHDRNATIDLGQINDQGLVTNLYAEQFSTNKISALEDRGNRDLVLESLETVSVAGSRGIQVNSGDDITVDANMAALLHSDTAISLDGENGIYLDLEQVPVYKSGVSRSNPNTYKVCICSSGSLFLIPGNLGAECPRHGKTMCQ